MNYFQCLLITGLIIMPQLAAAQQPNRRPNILWISTEDVSPRFDFYGDSTVKTPNLSRLARQGVIYDNAFTTAGVCAPSRCAIITGVNQVTAGGHNMRTLYSTFPEKTGLPKSYSIVPPPEIKAFPELLRAEGYYCTNNVKTDYQFIEPPTVWDETSASATWRNRKPGQPFFAIFNYVVTHESQVWQRKHYPLHADPARVPVPPIYPDTKTVRQDLARFYSNIVDLDSLVGILLNQLEEDHLLDSTIIFFWGDHGDGLPNYKRELYDRGLKIPLFVRYPDQRNAGQHDSSLISAIDFAPTVLSLAGIAPPAYMQGRAFLGKFKSKTPNTYIYAARDRMDSEYDRVRAIRDLRYKYIRNFHPELPRYQNIEFRLQQDMMVEMLQLRDAGKLNATQMRWFEPTKPAEELYAVATDPYELHDLASDPKYKAELLRMRKAMDAWLIRAHDRGATPEKELVSQMWNGGNTPPHTADVVVKKNSDGSLTLHSATPGASIGYKLLQNGTAPTAWQVYTKPLRLSPGTKVKVVAQRIGYEPSQESIVTAGN